MSIGVEDQTLITALLSVTEKLREGKFTTEEKDDLLDAISPYANHDKEDYIDIDLKVAWKYLMYGWAVSPLLDAVGIDLEKITSIATLENKEMAVHPVTFEFAPVQTRSQSIDTSS